MNRPRGSLPVPSSTYRVQLNRDFTLQDATRCAAYLRELGVSHLYASPCFTAREGSPHGYDVIDFSRVNPELGGEAALGRLVRELARRGLKLLLDIVPNHMCVAGGGNPWWMDVLEHGPASAYADFFDIDWQATWTGGHPRLLLPVLAEPLPPLLAKGEIRLDCENGAFWVVYGPSRFPLEPRSWKAILAEAASRRGLSPGSRKEMERLLTLLEKMPSFTESHGGKERSKLATEAKRRLARLTRGRGGIGRAIAQALAGAAGAGSLPSLLEAQPYRLAHWREGLEGLNYRRFFDVTDLAALRVERPHVFRAVHALVFRLAERGWVDGLRVDHVDGLWDPLQYLNRLRRGLKRAKPASPYIVVEKILAPDERLPPGWPVQGTTGYEFLNLLNGLFVAPGGGSKLRALYGRFTGRRTPFPEEVRQSKAQILRSSLRPELGRLARFVRTVAEEDRRAPKASLRGWEGALCDLISAFPVYRTYLSPGGAEPEDLRRLGQALRTSVREGSSRRRPLLRWLGRLMRRAAGGDDPAATEFVMRLQQLTGPAMAKGFEDTALYRHFPLASLNEVGGEPDIFGVPATVFHQASMERLRRHPGSLLATSTHDTKRSEDVRARLNVLSEIPEEWESAVLRWRELNRRWKRRIAGQPAPSPNAEYLLYQSLVGIWPSGEGARAPRATLVRRAQDYMLKAVREGKERTGWLEPDEVYEEALHRFIARILAPGDGRRFLAELREFVRKVEKPGLYNSLSQTLLKAASPGVPDVFQGCETVSLSLVDPDNRRPVDFERLKRALASLQVDDEELPALARRLMRSPEDGVLKLFVLSRILRFRRERPALFASGRYLPLYARGERKESLLAFARLLRGEEAIIVAGRYFARLDAASTPPLGQAAWGASVLPLPSALRGRTYRDVFTGRRHAPPRPGGNLPLADVLAELPVALLVRAH